MTSPAEAYDELSEGYDDFHVDGKSLAENRRMARYLRTFVRPHERVADLGCGTGLLLELLPLPPERYIGVEAEGEGFIAEMVDLVRNLGDTSGTTVLRRPPKMKALMGTPFGSSQCGSATGFWLAGAVKRAFGWAAGVSLSGVQSLPRQSMA